MVFANYRKIFNYNKNNYYNCQYIVVFCTKYNRKFLSESIKLRIKEIITKNSNKLEYKINSLDIFDNRVVLAIEVNPKIGIDKTIVRLKNILAKDLLENFPELKTRIPNIWTRKNFIATTGDVDSSEIDNFIGLNK